MTITRTVVAAAVFLLLALSPLASPQAAEFSADELIARFQKSWDEGAWLQKSRFRPEGYMRPLDDAGWKVRIKVLQALVRGGERAVPALEKALRSGDAPTRILAAQTLGYVAEHAALDVLLKAATSDPDPAVRLYAVDALGMRGAKDGAIDWQELLRDERNRDVKKHIRHAVERQGTPLSPAVVEKLKKWNSERIDSARVGRPAPDFELTAATGEKVRLSNYRGKKNVVLVFIYGDT